MWKPIPPLSPPPVQAKVSLASPNAPSSAPASLWFQRQTQSSELVSDNEVQVAAACKQSPAQSAVQLLDMLLNGGKAGPGWGGGACSTLQPTGARQVLCRGGRLFHPSTNGGSS